MRASFDHDPDRAGRVPGGGARRRALRRAWHGLPARECTAPPRRAFSFIEAAVATVILSGAVVTGMNLYGSYARGAAMEIERDIGQQLGAEFLSEILAKHFEDPDLPPGSFGREVNETGRVELDDVDDYNNEVETQPLTPDGLIRDDAIYEPFSRRVTVRNVDEATLTTFAANGATGAKAINVRVYKNQRLVADMRGYRTRHAAND